MRNKELGRAANRIRELGIRAGGEPHWGIGIGRVLKISIHSLGRKFLLILLIVNCSLLIAEAQSPAKYLITLKDKSNSPYSVSKPLEFLAQRSVTRRTKQNIAIVTRDLPVNPAYIAEIKKTGAKVWYSSRWMNAVMVECKSAVLLTILKLPFVKGLEVSGSIDDPLTRSGRKSAKFETSGTEAFDYGSAKTQVEMIGADQLHNQNFTGTGMLIGVLDAGFLNANTIAGLKPLFDSKRIVGTYDFVKKETSVYEDDGHGTEVLSCMAASLQGSMVGTAPDASYLLLRTEDAPSEYIIEEANWLFGAEYADSVGVDVINSSLGYTEFDDVSTSHTYAQLNGNTTIAARAADWAAAAGIVCVVSAGNDGQGSWKYISTPADADSIITVGAVTALKTYASFSSQGIPTDSRIKPDLVAMGQSSVIIDPLNGRVTTGSGTSFSSPIMCGMVACYWQANPTLTAMQVIDNLRKSGSQFTKPDRLLGYGIPTFPRILAIQSEETELFKVYPNPTHKTLTIELLEATHKNYEANLTDISGKTLWSEPLKNAVQTISVEKMASGVYFLRVGNEEKNSVVKVVVE
jgi:serine protease AprX